MEKRLELQFIDSVNKTITISIEEPIEPVDALAVSAAMDTIIAQNIFKTPGGDLVSKKGARVVTRDTADVFLA